MITEPSARSTHLLSAWSAGIALLCLVIGLHGAAVPLVPRDDLSPQIEIGDDAVMVEAFEPPAAAEDAPPQQEKEMIEEDVAIPPLPEITPPLTPPEMMEITPIEEVRELPKPMPVEKKPEPPKPRPQPKTQRTTSNPPTKAKSNSGTGGGGNGSSSSPVVFSGGGSGRFPSPAYPATARATKQQGTVRLLVTVEASGVPSSVSVTSSSGFAALDRAARDTIQRRWRWPSGAVRKYIVPVRFVLQ